MHNFNIKSHSTTYTVEFDDNLLTSTKINKLGTHYIVDKNVFELVKSQLDDKQIVVIDATEETKSYQGVEPIIDQLLDQKLKRDSILVAIGGGITQDITCFIATTFMRGIKWNFVPTTLLAQADSCIGSKSSINFGKYKNLLGSFNPPNHIIISNEFLDSLAEKEIQSGIGEIIKLYLIDGKLVSVEEIRNNLSEHLYATLQIKKRYIEEDEFDRGIRNILNYGHCFGHAIESATNFAIPHGIAVSMGMDVANQLSNDLNLITDTQLNSMRQILLVNYREFSSVPISINSVFNALTKDKKNTGNKINIILPVNDQIVKQGFNNDEKFWNLIRNTFGELPFNFH